MLLRIVRIIDALLHTYGLAVLGGYLLGYMPINLLLLEYYATAVWLLLWAAPVLLLIAIWRGQRHTVGLLLVCCCVTLVAHLPRFLPVATDAPTPETTALTVLSYNIFTVNGGKEQIAEQLRVIDADVVAIQELSSVVADFLADALHDIYPYQALHPQDFGWHFRGVGLLSKYPIGADRYWQFAELPETHGQQRAVIRIDEQPIVIYNVHIWPALALYSGEQAVLSRETTIAHQAALSRLIGQVWTETQPLILLGDFNMSPQFQDYRVLTTRLTDSFRQEGYGMGYTYPACGLGPLGAFVRIDYIFHSPNIATHRSRVLDGCPVSDHHPVWAELLLPPNSN